jgi:ribosome-binding factor A
MKPVKKDTNRIARVNSLIEHALGPVLLEYLSEFKGLVTISKVDTSRDMKWVKVWISIFNAASTRSARSGQNDNLKNDNGILDKKILDFLAKNIYYIQGEMNKAFHTKIIPRISFHLDTSPRYAQHIEELVKKVHGEEK